MISPSQMSVGIQYQCYTRKEIDDYISTIKMSIAEYAVKYAFK